jgi:uncharacterized protein (TIGR02246 family)
MRGGESSSLRTSGALAVGALMGLPTCHSSLTCFLDFAPAVGVSQLKNPEDAAAEFQAAWNKHDMEALGALFHADATFVNRFGHYVRGVDAIVALHAPLHASIYSDSALKNELIDAVPIGDAAAVVHFWSRLTSGPAHPAGPHAVDTLILAVLIYRGDAWKIMALENVTLTNPRTGEIVLRP